MTDKLISEQKLKAFSMGAMGKRPLSRREVDEMRKKEEEQAAAHVFQEFVATFQEEPSSTSTKVWIKAGTFDAGSRKEDTSDKGTVYRPQVKVPIDQHQTEHSHEKKQDQKSTSTSDQAQLLAKLISDKKPDRLGKTRRSGKSNLEAFKEELRQIQEEREERHKYKATIRNANVESEMDVFLKSGGDVGSFDTGDPNTTNLYLGNLNPKITEQQLMEVFGRYGPLASIKIMWPRSDEEKARGRNCGFVAYMSRKDGERALRALNGRDIMGFEMKMGWGKAVAVPGHPIYIPPALLELNFPPPPSGLPFNAQPLPKDRDILPKSADELNRILSRSSVKVVPPTDRSLLMLIHRMVEFVVREGPMLEAMIMNRELHNPNYRFLFENQNPLHIYYRWKIYSIMHGDSQKEWNTTEFCLFKGGSIWKPPTINNYSLGMPDELVRDDLPRECTKGTLSNTQRDRLEDLIRNLTVNRYNVGEAMVFCLEHSDASDEVSDCITESLTLSRTRIIKKIARFYLISDLLHNCSVKVNNACSYRKLFEQRLPVIMKHMHETYKRLESRIQSEGFKMRLLRVLEALIDSVYEKRYVNSLRFTFLGVDEFNAEMRKSSTSGIQSNTGDNTTCTDIDGAPLTSTNDTSSANDVTTSADGADLLKSAMKCYANDAALSSDCDSDDLDGKEIDIDGVQLPTESASNTIEQQQHQDSDGFISSKWEAVDPNRVKAEAMTTSKWDQFNHSSSLVSSTTTMTTALKDRYDVNDDIDGRSIKEVKRAKIREIEMKAVQYEDELESGQQNLRSGWTVQQQVQHYRLNLLNQSIDDYKHKSKGSHDADISNTNDDSYIRNSCSKRSHLKRQSKVPSSDNTKSRSRSPPLKQRHYSPPSLPNVAATSSTSSYLSRSHSPSTTTEKTVSSSSRYAIKPPPSTTYVDVPPKQPPPPPSSSRSSIKTPLFSTSPPPQQTPSSSSHRSSTRRSSANYTQISPYLTGNNSSNNTSSPTSHVITSNSENSRYRHRSSPDSSTSSKRYRSHQRY